MILSNCNYSKLRKYDYLRDIPFLENYLALYLCIKPIKDKNGDSVSEKRKYLTSAEALRLMGLDIKECKKIGNNSKL